MELATERDAEWLSSVVCYEILSAGPAGKLLARKPGDASESPGFLLDVPQLK